MTTSFRVLSAALALAVLPAAAQELDLGVHGGPSLPHLSGGGGNQLTQDYASRKATNFGLVAEAELGSAWSLVLQLDEAGQGGVRTGMQPITNAGQLPPLPAGQYLYADFRNESDLTYLELPVLARHRWAVSPVWRFYVEGGPYFGWLVEAKQKTSGTSTIYLDPGGTMPLTVQGATLPPQDFGGTIEVRDSLRRYNWGLTAGVGVEWVPASHQRLYLDLRGEYGLRRIQADPADGSASTGCLVVSLGWCYRLGG